MADHTQIACFCILGFVMSAFAMTIGAYLHRIAIALEALLAQARDNMRHCGDRFSFATNQMERDRQNIDARLKALEAKEGR